MAGASHTTLLDLDPDALACATRGMAANAVLGGFVATEMNWNEAPEEPEALPGPFDVVLACDIFFQPGLLPPLARLLTRLTAPGGTLFAVQPIDSEHRHQATRQEADAVIARIRQTGAWP